MQSPPEQTPLEMPERFGRLLGYRLAAWQDGHAEVVLTLAPDHRSRNGIPHGGVITALIDTASSYSGCYCPVPGNRRRAVTLSINTQFIGQPRSGETLTAVARRIGGGRRIFFTRCEVRGSAGALIAQGEAVFRYLRGSESPEGEPIGPDGE